MYLRGSLWVAVAGCLTLGVTACSGSDVASSAQGGTGGVGGISSTGGSGGSVTTAGTAGTNTLGGSAASAGSGGSAGQGGATGAAGAGGAGGAGGAAGGPAAYNPCPTDGSPCRIMPLGDSITDGGGSHNAAYRYELFRLALQNQKKLTFVGSKASGPDTVDGQPFPKATEGHSGWTIDDGGGREGLYPKIVGWLTTTPADIVTLMIGTNDIDINLDRPNAPMRLGLLIDRIATQSPNALIVVAQIVPTQEDAGNVPVIAYNAAIPALVDERAKAGKHVVLVDMYGAFTKNADYKTAWLGDRLHPNDAGLVVMAATWWAAIGDLLPK